MEGLQEQMKRLKAELDESRIEAERFRVRTIHSYTHWITLSDLHTFTTLIYCNITTLIEEHCSFLLSNVTCFCVRPLKPV